MSGKAPKYSSKLFSNTTKLGELSHHQYPNVLQQYQRIISPISLNNGEDSM